ncbi:MAG: molybdate ABC transporter substrate-binding protein [Lentisphaerae bacterium]|nr:molybdate ABC transporter substrate-binding protein [Lentisphaerota bacterium]
MKTLNMRKFLVMLFVAVFSVSVLAGCGGETQETENTPNENAQQSELSGELLISAAASMKESMAEVETMFNEANPDVELTFNFGSSGSLQQQIEQGAPADVFVSAGKKQMQALVDKDLIAEGTYEEILQNEVVLIVPADKTDITTFDDLTTDKVVKLALGEFNSVPVGQYSKEILDSLELSAAVADKSVYAKDVKEVLSWVSTGNADAGMVYATDAKTVADKVKVVVTAPADAYSPAVYPVGIVKATENRELADAFIDFIKTDDVKDVFVKYGFTVLY